ncbi:conserved hypothetical protein [Ricinus communis]|uniref:Uncharacterized protein n=1 Tax=Ricinus communis TaxID=3988 RepID=B9TBI8_RICCO|nr:conserved hypothetical protein [Ricinus communis]
MARFRQRRLQRDAQFSPQSFFDAMRMPARAGREENCERQRSENQAQQLCDTGIEQRGDVVVHLLRDRQRHQKHHAVATAEAGTVRLAHQVGAEQQKRRHADGEQHDAIHRRQHEGVAEHRGDQARGKSLRHRPDRRQRRRCAREQRRDDAAHQCRKKSLWPVGVDPEHADHDQRQHRARTGEQCGRAIGARHRRRRRHMLEHAVRDTELGVTRSEVARFDNKFAHQEHRTIECVARLS